MHKAAVVGDDLHQADCTMMVVWMIPQEASPEVRAVLREMSAVKWGRISAPSGGPQRGSGALSGLIAGAGVRRRGRAAFASSQESKLVEPKPLHVEIRVVAIRVVEVQVQHPDGSGRDHRPLPVGRSSGLAVGLSPNLYPGGRSSLAQCCIAGRLILFQRHGRSRQLHGHG
jgi:hypothetical protein